MGCYRLHELPGLDEALEVLELFEVLELLGSQTEGHSQVIFWKRGIEEFGQVEDWRVNRERCDTQAVYGEV